MGRNSSRRKKGRDISGIIVVNKPYGASSNHVLQQVKTLFNANKAGHTGALDPLATGLLPICLGEATKFSQLLLESDKAYDTTATLGEIRSTGDAEGEVLKQAPIPVLAEDDIEEILTKFRGNVEQVPPMFSALKLDGKPLYKLARKGVMSDEEMRAVAEKKRRTIQINSLVLNEFGTDTIQLSVQCSKGTYIRTLVEDIGEAIGSGAYVSRLHRTQSGPYHAEQMVTLEELERIAEEGGEAALDALLLPAYTALPESWPKIELNEADATKILHGQAVSSGLKDTPSVQLWAVGSGVSELLGIGRIKNKGIRPQRLLQERIPKLD